MLMGSTVGLPRRSSGRRAVTTPEQPEHLYFMIGAAGQEQGAVTRSEGYLALTVTPGGNENKNSQKVS